MHYVSTRGETRALGFEDVLLAGLARDGGLYVPEEWPRFSAGDIRDMAGRSYTDIALAIIRPFTGDFLDEPQLKEMINAAYAGFSHPAVTPLMQLDSGQWLLELHRGPTLAFKDIAMQLLAPMMDLALQRRGRRASVICATSGDTGGAAIEAFKNREAVDVFVLHPHGRVSEVQRRQMTTVTDSNIHNIAIEGSFDDCQAIVKDLFNDHEFRDRHALAGVNSINWARVLPQIVYYFAAAIALGAPDRKIGFTVPTGNFGDIFAGYAARRMGLPVGQLVIATNQNDILHRALSGGRYEVGKVAPSISPSMDIQVSSNFERLLFEEGGRDAAPVRGLMASLAQSGSFALPDALLANIRAQFGSARVSEAKTRETIRTVYERTGFLIDPHTAVGVGAAPETADGPMVVLATAHAAKFPDAVEQATGVHPALPAHLADLFERPERFSVQPGDSRVIGRFIAGKTRANAGGGKKGKA